MIVFVLGFTLYAATHSDYKTMQRGTPGYGGPFNNQGTHASLISNDKGDNFEMKQFFRFMFFLLISLSIPLTATAQVVIPDAGLRAAIEKTLDKASGATITTSDMAKLTGLEAINANITDLTGLEHATNLTALFLSAERVGNEWQNSNAVSDLSPLSGLTNLTRLTINFDTLTDISPLSGLTNLTELYLWDNSITDISAVAGLTNLTGLSLGSNNITDISPLAGLTNLTGLWLNGNNITDISALVDLTNLATLWLGWNNITDLSPLVANTGLGSGDTVNVRGNPLNRASIETHIPTLQGRGVTVEFDIPLEEPVHIPDANLRAAIESALGEASGAPITPSDMAKLTGLEAINANITDLTGLEGASNLTWLNLNGERVEGRVINSNSVSNLSPLSGLTKLTGLWLQHNAITDISPVAGLTNLTQLELGSNNISDISAIAGLTNLTRLGLWENSIPDISAVSGLTKLVGLWLWDNAITDISAVAGLTNLTYLALGGNNISDISAVSGLTNLMDLHLPGNNISDVAPLVANMGLGNEDRVNLRGNPLNRASIETHIPALQGRGVTVEFDNVISEPVTIPRYQPPC